MYIGELINNYLSENSLSQRQFAKRCGLSSGYISMLVNNKNPKTQKPLIPSLNSLLSIASGMGITIDELFEKADDIQVDISVIGNSVLNVSDFNGMKLSSKERMLISAYRAHPEMQSAVDTLLGIQNNVAPQPAPQKLYEGRVAAFGAGPETIYYTEEDMENIRKAKEEYFAAHPETEDE